MSGVGPSITGSRVPPRAFILPRKPYARDTLQRLYRLLEHLFSLYVVKLTTTRKTCCRIAAYELYSEFVFREIRTIGLPDTTRH